MTHNFKTPLLAASAVLILAAASASTQPFPTDFAQLDSDNNGQVSFAEYSSFVKASGITTTAAAAQFTRMSAGDALITEDEFNLALAFQDQPYALQNINGGAEVNFVSSAPAFDPPVSEVQYSPIMESEPMILEEVPAPAPAQTVSPDTSLDISAPEIEVIEEPATNMTSPIKAVTPPEIILEEATPDGPDIEAPEPLETGDVLGEDELEVEPEPEG